MYSTCTCMPISNTIIVYMYILQGLYTCGDFPPNKQEVLMCICSLLPFLRGTVNEKAMSHSIVLSSDTPSPRPIEGQPTNTTSLIWGRPISLMWETGRPNWNLF